MMRTIPTVAALATLLIGGCALLLTGQARAQDAPASDTDQAGVGAEEAETRTDGQTASPEAEAHTDPVLTALVQCREKCMEDLRAKYPLTEEEANAYRELISEYALTWGAPRNREISFAIHEHWRQTLPILSDMMDSNGPADEAFRRALRLLPNHVSRTPSENSEQGCINEMVALMLIPYASSPDAGLRFTVLQASFMMLVTKPGCECVPPPLRSQLQSRARDIVRELCEDERSGIRRRAREYWYRLGMGPAPPPLGEETSQETD